MMKKYNLHLKEEYRGKRAVECPEVTGNIGRLGVFRGLYVLVGEIGKCTLSNEESDCKTEITQQEIDKLPHGFVKLFDLIEVEEELYYIKFPYADGRFLNEDLRNGKVDFYGKSETSDFKAKFTMSEIEEKYSLLRSFAVKVEEIDNE